MKRPVIFTFVLVLASLAGCTVLPPPDTVYKLRVGSSDSSSVSVIDNRPAAQKIPRMKDGSTIYLGDNNFVPARFDVLKERLSSELPRSPQTTVIHIDSFEFMVWDSTRQGGITERAIVPGTERAIVPALIGTELARAWWKDRTVICAISGRANGAPFEVNEFKTTSPKKIGDGFDDVLTIAVRKIVQRIAANAPSK